MGYYVAMLPIPVIHVVVCIHCSSPSGVCQEVRPLCSGRRYTNYLCFFFIKALQHKYRRSVRYQVLQPAKDVKFRTVCLKGCIQEKNP